MRLCASLCCPWPECGAGSAYRCTCSAFLALQADAMENCRRTCHMRLCTP